MFGKKVRPAALRVGDNGLYRIMNDLIDAEGMIGFGDLLHNGMRLSLRPAYVDGEFIPSDWIVFLNGPDTEYLLNKLPRRTLQDEYGRGE